MQCRMWLLCLFVCGIVAQLHFGSTAVFWLRVLCSNCISQRNGICSRARWRIMGIRQKLGLRRGSSQAGPEAVNGGGYGVLKRWFKRGKLSAQETQEAASHMIGDSPSSSSSSPLGKLAKAGRVGPDRKPTNKKRFSRHHAVIGYNKLSRSLCHVHFAMGLGFV